jgi:branched-chain amino acid transport system permease protein
MTTIIQQLVDAVSAGSTYVLLGLGLSLIYSVMGLINFAYGMLIVWGGYVIAVSVEAGIPYAVAFLLMSACVVAMSVATERFAFRPFRGAPPSTLLLTSFGVELALQAIAIAAYGDNPRPVPSPRWLQRSASIGTVHISWLEIASVVAGGLVLVGLHLLLTRTRLGLEMRAVAEDREVSQLLGVRSERVFTMAFAIAGLVAAIVTVLWVAKLGTVEPTSDLTPTLIAFIVVVIGGIGTTTGAIVGGLLLGLVETLLSSYLPTSLQNYQEALVFLIAIAVLLGRPQGIAGRLLEVSK